MFQGRGAVYLHGDAVFLKPRGAGPASVTKVGLLTSEAKLLSRQLQGRRPAPSPLRTLGHLVHRLDEFAFTVMELIPTARSLRDASGEVQSCSPEVLDLLKDLGHRVRELGNLQYTPPFCEIPVNLLAEWLRAPCAIEGYQVVPLQPVRFFHRADCDVVIEGTRYRRVPELSRPLQQVLADVAEAGSSFIRASVPGESLTGSRLVSIQSLVDAIIANHDPQVCPNHLILYHDADLQVQFSGGHCGLVRGPIGPGIHARPVYLGLPVLGKNRAQRLSVKPRVLTEADGMWRTGAPPDSRGLCTGRESQYRHLLSDQFTGAEALIQWVDAGVTVSGARLTTARRAAMALQRRNARVQVPRRRV